MKKIKLNHNKGILFWVTGLSGSGKTSIAREIKHKISKLYGPTIVVSGDDMRKIFGLFFLMEELENSKQKLQKTFKKGRKSKKIK